VKKSCVAAYPVGWPDGRGISGRMRVEWVAGSPWNRWSDAHGMGGQMTVESAVLRRSLLDGDYKELSMTSRHAIKAAASPLLHSAHLIGCSLDKQLRKASS